jgi:5-methylcytosine-specific restriction endonuclease McrA
LKGAPAMIFIDNKYTTWYNNIVQRAKTRSLTEYKERHHIIPRSLGGSNLKENLVDLTAREHFVCHWLLTKMVVSPYKEKMIYAAWTMANLENHNQQRHKITGRIYELLRQQYSRIKSIHTKTNNPMHDPEVRKKHQAAIARRGKTSGNTGHKRGPLSNKLKQILSQKTTDQMTPERREMIRQQQLNRTTEQKEKYAFAHSERISCVYCQKPFAPGHFGRWHGDKCKSK